MHQALVDEPADRPQCIDVVATQGLHGIETTSTREQSAYPQDTGLFTG
jgi:hypothetical protein